MMRLHPFLGFLMVPLAVTLATSAKAQISSPQVTTPQVLQPTSPGTSIGTSSGWQSSTSPELSPEALQRILRENPSLVAPPRAVTGSAQAGIWDVYNCPTCMPGGYGPGGPGGYGPLVFGGSHTQVIPGRWDFSPVTEDTGRPKAVTLVACVPVHLKVGPSKIGVINGSDQTLTFSVKFGATEQIVKLAPGEIETVSVPAGGPAVAGTSDNRIPAQTLAGGTVYRLKAQNGKWAFVAD